MTDASMPFGIASVIEAFFQEPLNLDLASKIETLPTYQACELLERIDRALDLWYQRQKRAQLVEAINATHDQLSFQPIFSHDASISNQHAINRWLKCCLLYFPGSVTIPDPILSGHSSAYIGIALSDRDSTLVRRICREIAVGVRESIPIRPLIANGEILPIPWDAVGRVSERASTLIALLSVHGGTDQEMDLSDFSREERAELLEYYIMKDLFVDIRGDEIVDIDVIGTVVSEWFWVGSKLGRTPIAADGRSRAVLTSLQRQDTRSTKLDRAAGELISSFRIPGPDNASLSDVVELRLNEVAFHDFRGTFEDIIRGVAGAEPDSQFEFDLEFQRHALSALEARSSRIREVSGISRSLEQIMTGAFLLGAAFLEWRITHNPPIGSLLAGGATESAWLLSQRHEKRRTAKEIKSTKKFLGYLTPTA